MWCWLLLLVVLVLVLLVQLLQLVLRHDSACLHAQQSAACAIDNAGRI